MGGGMMDGFAGFGGAMGNLGLFGSPFGLIFSLGLLAVLALAGIWLWNELGSPTGTGLTAQPQEVRSPSALEVLKIRYARGELTRDEFQTIMRNLR
jgi:putative membrane protein